MPDPRPRIDADYSEEAEMAVTEAFLYRLAEMVNAKTRAGRIYGQILLPPEEAAAKRAAMEGRNG